MSLDGYNLQGGGELFSVEANFITFYSEIQTALTVSNDYSVSQPLGSLFAGDSLKTQVAGKFLMIDVDVDTNTNTGTTKLIFLKNGMEVGEGVTYAATETGAKFKVEEIDFVVDDELQIRVTIAGAGSVKFNKVVCVMNIEETV